MDCARVASFANTSEDSPASRQHRNLGDVVASVGTIEHVHIIRIPEHTLSTGHNRTVRRTWNIGDACDLRMSPLEVITVASFSLESLHLQVVEADSSLVAAVGESRVIVEPVDVHNCATVTLALLVRWALSGVEVVDVGVAADTSSKQVAAIAETEFTTALQLDLLVLLD